MARKRKRKRSFTKKKTSTKRKKSKKQPIEENAINNLICGSIWRVKTEDEEVTSTGKAVLSGWKRCQVIRANLLACAFCMHECSDL